MFRFTLRKNVVTAMGLAGSALLGTAEAREGPPGRASAQETEAGAVKVEVREESPITKASSLTVSLREALTPRLRVQIADAVKRCPDATVRLTLRGVAPPSNPRDILGFRVFVNKPDADVETPDDDPHYVKSIAFAPTTGGERQAFAFDVAKTLAALEKREEFNVLDPRQPFTVTVVAIPASVSRRSDEASFSIRDVILLVPERRPDR